MSSNETQAALSRAFELVEAGKLDEARAIVEPILAADKNNADAWWIYAHAVTDPDAGRAALENVLRIDPNHREANDLFILAQEQLPPKPTITLLPQTMPEAPTHLPEANFPDLDHEEATPPTREIAAPRSRFPVVPILAVIVIVALVLLVVLTQSGGTPAATATPTEVASSVIVVPTQSVAQSATEQATASAQLTQQAAPSVTPTAIILATEAATGEATAESTADFTALRSALSSFPVAQNGIGEVTSSLGDTVQVSVCSTQGRAMRTLLPQVMNALAKQSPSLGGAIQAVGVRMINCDQNTPLLAVAVDLKSAQSYAAGTLNDSQFAALWKPQ